MILIGCFQSIDKSLQSSVCLLEVRDGSVDAGDLLLDGSYAALDSLDILLDACNRVIDHRESGINLVNCILNRLCDCGIDDSVVGLDRFRDRFLISCSEVFLRLLESCLLVFDLLCKLCVFICKLCLKGLELRVDLRDVVISLSKKLVHPCLHRLLALGDCIHDSLCVFFCDFISVLLEKKLDGCNLCLHTLILCQCCECGLSPVLDRSDLAVYISLKVGDLLVEFRILRLKSCDELRMVFICCLQCIDKALQCSIYVLQVCE